MKPQIKINTVESRQLMELEFGSLFAHDGKLYQKIIGSVAVDERTEEVLFLMLLDPPDVQGTLSGTIASVPEPYHVYTLHAETFVRPVRRIAELTIEL